MHNGAIRKRAAILSVAVGLVLLASCAPTGPTSSDGSTTTTTRRGHHSGGDTGTTTTTDGNVNPNPPVKPTTTTTTRPSSTTTAPPATTTTAGGGGTTSGLWKPSSAHSLGFQWVLGGALNLSDPVQMGLRDFNGNTLPAPAIYDIDGEENSAATVAALHAQGKKVVCYMDAGVYEDYRTDAGSFPASVIGSNDAGWEGSYWLDVRQISILQPIMQARIAMCKSKGFDAVEPDEIDGYSNDPGFPITYAQQLAYNKAFAGWVHAAGMSVLLKGDIEQAVDLQPSFDFTLNEECNMYSECSPSLDAFSNAGKAVFIAEYPEEYAFNSGDCTEAASKHWNLSWYKLGLPNNGGRQPCTQTW